MVDVSRWHLVTGGVINDLDRQKARLDLRNGIRFRRKARITQSLEDQVRVHRISARHLGNRYVRGRRLKTDRPLLLVRPKPLRSTRHPMPRSVHYLWWTLSNTLYARQGSDAGRLLSQFDAAPLIAFTATKETNYGANTALGRTKT